MGNAKSLDLRLPTQLFMIFIVEWLKQQLLSARQNNEKELVARRIQVCMDTFFFQHQLFLDGKLSPSPPGRQNKPSSLEFSSFIGKKSYRVASQLAFML